MVLSLVNNLKYKNTKQWNNISSPLMCIRNSFCKKNKAFTDFDGIMVLL